MNAFIVCLTVFFSSCLSRSVHEGPHAASSGLDSLQRQHDISTDAIQWADSVISTMTLEQLVGQLIMPAVNSDVSRASLRRLREYAIDGHIGGVVLLRGTVAAAREIADTLRSMLPVAPFIAIDAEWGLAMRLEATPEFPRNGRISSRADESVMFDYGYELARECREVGVNMVLGPVLDVLPEGNRQSGIGTRSFGKDPARTATLGVAYAKGMESGGVVSVAKHFPGHGSADADSHRCLPVVAKTRSQLASSDLIPFLKYMANGMSAIMTGHLFVPALDEQAIPVTVSKRILTDFVRDSLQFRGLIVTDAINMAGASGHSAADAIMAGADIVLAPADTDGELKAIVEAVADGRMPVATLLDRVRRVLFYKFLFASRDDGTGNIGDISEAERIIKLLRTPVVE